jgi:hypothetical protein
MNEAEFFFFTTIFMLVVASIGMIGWYRATAKRAKLEGQLWGLATGQGLPISAMLEGGPTGSMPRLSGAEASRVERLEHQVDQMAQQMERISESQDFISRVLTDRIEQLPDPRMRTPH